jgi:DNA-nicking Smr family endonuclease
LTASGENDEPFAIPITGDLDLHPFAPREIPSLVRDYLQACRERGILRVRLAHGRGRGVQRAVVRRLLASLPEVVSAHDAPPESGGWGATLAELAPLSRPGTKAE